jgi:hypothetical protein
VIFGRAEKPMAAAAGAQGGLPRCAAQAGRAGSLERPSWRDPVSSLSSRQAQTFDCSQAPLRTCAISTSRRSERSRTGVHVFIVRRSGFKLTRSFYILVIILLAVTGSFGLLLTMHIHLGPLRRTKEPSSSKDLKNRKLSPDEIPECDLPPLPNREGPFEYKGHPYYLYPNGDVDGFTRQGWWRISFDEFKRHVDGKPSLD